MPFAAAPATFILVLSAVTMIAGLFVLHRTSSRLAPQRPRPAEHTDGLRDEPPAVVNLLTNDVTVTAAGFRSTLLDLAARGWLKILPPDEEDELARVRPAAAAGSGDSLLPHERLVLQHVLARYTSEQAIPARFLAVDIRGSWWARFAGLVERDAAGRGLVSKRWTVRDLAPPTALAVLSLLLWWWASAAGDEGAAVADSIELRVAGAIVLIGGVVLAVKVLGRLRKPLLTHTEEGLTATAQWLDVRRRLVDAGIAAMAPSSLEPGDRRLPYASAMCLAEAASVELPLAREDHYRAWSSMGGSARLVRVQYPHRLGYGLHPFAAVGLGIALTVVGVVARRWFGAVAKGDALTQVYDKFPDQTAVISDIATALAVASWLPIVLGLLVAVGGAVDGFRTLNRTGVVLRARRPAEVSPLPRRLRRMLERDRYSLYIAVDDGSSDSIRAWRCSERTAVPQGARATVEATPFLGHVRSATPVGHRLS